MKYAWPTKPFNNKPGKKRGRHLILSTFGEFRGQGAGDGIAFLHSGFDIPETGGNLKVYSPDVGLVRRFGAAANGNPSAGGGPIRVGHFAFNHINNILAKPGRKGLRADLKIYVANSGDTLFRPDKKAIRKAIKRLKKQARKNKKPFVGITSTSQLTDALVKPTKLKGKPRIGLRKMAANSYEAVTFYPRTLPIGRGVGPTDLHIVYYATPDGPVTDRGNLRNPLAVMKNYRNSKLPEIGDLGLYANTPAETLILKFNKVGDSGMLTPAMNGANFKALAFSAFAQVCGVYQLDYQIDNNQGQTTGRSRMWTFDALPSDANSKRIVDDRLSFFPGAKAFNNKALKKTVYRFTRSNGGVINKANHFELENVAKWKDGQYTLLIWLQNIAKANGDRAAPSVNEVKYCFGFKVTTVNKTARQITVTKAPLIVEVNSRTVKFVDGKMKFEDEREGDDEQRFEFNSAQILERVGASGEFVIDGVFGGDQPLGDL